MKMMGIHGISWKISHKMMKISPKVGIIDENMFIFHLKLM